MHISGCNELEKGRQMQNYKKIIISTITGLGLLCSTSSFAAIQDEVVVSIKPLHSLVSAVMEGVGTPKLIVQGAGSAHSYSLKPSDAAILQNAEIVFWTGKDMETFLEKPLQTLAHKAKIVPLSETDNLKLLRNREGGAFEAHEHGGEDHGHENLGHEGHSSVAHGHGHNDHHVHGQYDMHIWLDPENAKILLEKISQTLSTADPAHAQQYQDNAKHYLAQIDELEQQMAAELAPIKNKPFIVFHDAYQYLEKHFGLDVAGSITISPDRTPGAARIQQIKDKVKELKATCVFSEPQFEPRLVNTVLEGTNAKSGILDPLGADLRDGPSLYLQLMRNLAKSLNNCLART